MYSTKNCGELTTKNINQTVTLCGWVSIIRDKGSVLWIDLRDRYGVTQILLDQTRTEANLFETARTLGREFVIKVTGKVIEREAKNTKINTGEIEILATEITILNLAETPPFTIEDDTDGGEEIRMKYRYLDIRRNPVKDKLVFRHKIAQEVRKYLSDKEFIEVETPVLIKSTPEGARDFVVPSRMNPGEFYALPQSPQTFKQLLMVGGIDKYFQIVKCFRDEDLRADRQPEFTQIDCEMSFVTQEEIIQTFEGLMIHLLKVIKNVTINNFPRITYEQAMQKYGSDKPDTRFGMEFVEITNIVKGKGFSFFDSQELVVGIVVKNAATYTRKQIDELIEWVKRPQVGASGIIWAKYEPNSTLKSSVDKFYTTEELTLWAAEMKAEKGDLMLLMAGKTNETRKQLSALRIELAETLGLRDPNVFSPLWVVDFPLLEWDENTKRFHAMHHPFTSPKIDSTDQLNTNPENVIANAYDLVINGNEIGGGSIRVHDNILQSKLFKLLGFSEEEANKQFGFLLNAFKYGAPPHGGLAFGFDRLVSILDGSEVIRDYIAFPKNNSGRDVMIDAPSQISEEHLKELNLRLNN
ncbi:MAG: aspartate--tRNA ligase [Solirubrobacteraceae bacterium]